MQAPYYQNNQNFSPSAETLYAWLKTRKSTSQIKPGLIETIDYPRDLTWSIFAILIELSAFFLTLFGAWDIFQENHNLSRLITAIILVVVFIGFDIIGIMLHGQDKPNKVLLKSQATVEHDPIQRQFLLNQIDKITFRTFLGTILLCISSLLKIVAISVFFKQNAGPAGIFVLIIFYIVVIYIHIYHTGYWWSARKVHKKIIDEFNAHQQNQRNGTPDPYEVTNPSIQLFSSPFPMDNSQTTLQSNRQKIIFIKSGVDSNGTTVFDYQLTSQGVMWDSDVNQILAFNSHHFNQYLIDACINLQLVQLNQFIVAKPFTTLNNNIQNQSDSSTNN
jgi:hypothetical protein